MKTNYAEGLAHAKSANDPEFVEVITMIDAVDKILEGRSSDIVGAVLAEMVAQHIARHRLPGRDDLQQFFREKSFQNFRELVFALVKCIDDEHEISA